MGTVIDSLVVELGLDPKEFQKGRAAIEKSFKDLIAGVVAGSDEVESKVKKTGYTLLDFRNQILELGGAFLSFEAIKSFVGNITQAGIAIDRTARLTDESIPTIGAWRYVAEQTGGSAEDITGSMLGLTNQMQNLALTGESSTLPYFRALGISLVDSNGKFKTANDLLLDLSDKFSTMDPARAGAIGQALGLSPATINLLIKGRAAVTAMLDAARKNASTAADIAAEVAFNKQMDALEQSATRLGRTLATDLYPALSGILGVMQALASGNWDKAWSNWETMSQHFYDKLWNFGWNNAPVFPGAGGGDIGHERAMEYATGNILSSNVIGLMDEQSVTPEQAMTYYQARGMTAAQAAAFVASLKWESGLKAGAIGDHGEALGIGQWHKDRQRVFATMYGHDMKHSTAWEQLDFALYELRQGKEKAAGRELFSSHDLIQALLASMAYERPAGWKAGVNAPSFAGRLNIARHLISGHGTTKTVNAKTTIGHVTVNTKATDAKGIAKDFHKEVLAASANYGPN